MANVVGKLLPRSADHGKLRTAKAEAVVANLPIHIAEREVRIVGERLGWSRDELHAREEKRAQGPGNVLLLTLRFDHVTEVFTGFGQPGVSPESVAKRAVESTRKYLSSNVAIGHHLADQLVLPMALAGAGAFTTERPSRHLLTNAEVIEKFIDIRIEARAVDSKRWHVTIGG